MTLSSTRTISFVPPDGAFDLMTYRLSTQVKPLIWVEAQIERHSRSRMEIMVKARSQFKERKFLLQRILTMLNSETVSRVSDLSEFNTYEIDVKNGGVLKHVRKSFPGGIYGDILSNVKSSSTIQVLNMMWNDNIHHFHRPYHRRICSDDLPPPSPMSTTPLPPPSPPPTSAIAINHTSFSDPR
ncbi:unnamed protein product [Lactuca virosa]|uniref:MHD domain-containing protein n=1 Tax=Lactuca virosa TaxID=75947 RepID=A0AAU9P6M5_9ASTR|nr:unnamed protein product [Lactuca virosa]